MKGCLADEIEKEIDEALPCCDDMVRAERLRACPARAEGPAGGQRGRGWGRLV